MSNQQVIDQMVFNFYLAQDARGLAHNKALLVTFRDTLAINNKGGPRMFDPDNIESFDQANACRDQFILCYGETPHLPIGPNPLSPFFPTWRLSVNVPPPAPIVLNHDQLADQLANDYFARFPNALSFHVNNPDSKAADFHVKLSCHLKQRKITASPYLQLQDSLSILLFLEEIAVCWHKGSSISMMEAISPPVLFSLLSSMIPIYSEYLGQYTGMDPRKIPERTFVKYFLLYSKIISSANKRTVLKHLVSYKMSDDSSAAFHKYNGEFLLNISVLAPALLDQNPSSMAELHANGLQGFIKESAIDLLNIVTDNFHTQYLFPLQQSVAAYKEVEDYIFEVKQKATTAVFAENTEPTVPHTKVTVAAASAAAPVPHVASAAAEAAKKKTKFTRICKNDHSDGHIFSHSKIRPFEPIRYKSTINNTTSTSPISNISTLIENSETLELECNPTQIQTLTTLPFVDTLSLPNPIPGAEIHFTPILGTMSQEKRSDVLDFFQSHSSFLPIYSSCSTFTIPLKPATVRGLASSFVDPHPDRTRMVCELSVPQPDYHSDDEVDSLLSTFDITYPTCPTAVYPLSEDFVNQKVISGTNKIKSLTLLLSDCLSRLQIMQAITTGNSTRSILLGANALLLPNLLKVCNFVQELGHDKRSVEPGGISIRENNTSMMKAVFSDSNTGNIKYILPFLKHHLVTTKYCCSHSMY